MNKSKSKIVVISTLDNFEEERLPILISKAKISILATSEVDITIISMDTYFISSKF